MKKILTILIAAAVFALAGCSDSEKDYSALLSYANDASKNDMLEVKLGLIFNDSRMISGNPAASTAGAESEYEAKRMKVEITNEDGTVVLYNKDNLTVNDNMDKGKFNSIYISSDFKKYFDNATVTVTGYILNEDEQHEFTKGSVSNVDLTSGKTIYVPMEYIISESVQGSIEFDVGFYNSSDWKANGWNNELPEGLDIFEVSLKPLKGGEPQTLTEVNSLDYFENNYNCFFLAKEENQLSRIKIRASQKSGYYELLILWKNCQVMTEAGDYITTNISMIVGDANIICIPVYDTVVLTECYEPKYVIPSKIVWTTDDPSAEGNTGLYPSMPLNFDEAFASICESVYSEWTAHIINYAGSTAFEKWQDNYNNLYYYYYDVAKTKEYNVEKISIAVNLVDSNTTLQYKSFSDELGGIATGSIAVKNSNGTAETFPAELQCTDDYIDYATGYKPKFTFYLKNNTKIKIVNKDFNPYAIDVYVDSDYPTVGSPFVGDEDYATLLAGSFAVQEVDSDVEAPEISQDDSSSVNFYSDESNSYARDSSKKIYTVKGEYDGKTYIFYYIYSPA